jgi:hypothetical protein
MGNRPAPWFIPEHSEVQYGNTPTLQMLQELKNKFESGVYVYDEQPGINCMAVHS